MAQRLPDRPNPRWSMRTLTGILMSRLMCCMVGSSGPAPTTLFGKEPHKDKCASRFFMINIGRGARTVLPMRWAFLAATGSGFVTAQVLAVDGGRMDYIGHGERFVP